MTQMTARLYQRPRARFRHWEPGFFSMQFSFRRSLFLAVALTVLAASSGCVYRPNISQGNIVEEEDLDKVEIGMTRNQVRFVLGRPMIADQFHRDRWDYVYYVKVGRGSTFARRWVTVFFEDDLVSEILPDQELNPDL